MTNFKHSKNATNNIVNVYTWCNNNTKNLDLRKFNCKNKTIISN